MQYAERLEREDRLGSKEYCMVNKNLHNDVFTFQDPDNGYSDVHQRIEDCMADCLAEDSDVSIFEIVSEPAWLLRLGDSINAFFS